MTSSNFVCGLLSGLLVLGVFIQPMRGEDFSVHLDQLAAIDAKKPLPAYTLSRKVKETKKDYSGLPVTVSDVYVHFKNFGDVRLGETLQFGPAPKGYQNWKEGEKHFAKLRDMKSVKLGRLKGSPDLLIAAWVIEPDTRGNSTIFSHGYVILQLKDKKANVLLRGEHAICFRLRGGIQESVSQIPYFSWDVPAGRLVERISRYHQIDGRFTDPLTYRAKGWEGESDRFIASIQETITVFYNLVAGKFVPVTARLEYTTQKKDRLANIARYYLGPFAPRETLLKANPHIKVKEPGYSIYLPEKTTVRIPMPAEWLIKKFAHRPAQGEEKPTVGSSKTQAVNK